MNLARTAAVVAREPDRQLSKKELKKKELAELDAVLAELGLNQQDVKGDMIIHVLFKVCKFNSRC